MEHYTVSLEYVGDKVGLTLPAVLLENMRLAAGDEFCVIQDGQNILLMPATEDMKQALSLCDEGMLEYKDVLAQMAKDD